MLKVFRQDVPVDSRYGHLGKATSFVFNLNGIEKG